MGVMIGLSLRDKRGHEIEANAADCVNIDRTPRVREQILEGRFHRIASPSGNGQVTIEKTFFYADFGRRQFFLVLPRWDRHKWREATRYLRYMLAEIPESLAPTGERKGRVVFGLAELREKLIAFDAELNDRLVEVLKAILLCEHPFLLQHPRLNLVLNRIDAASVEFIASYDHHSDRYLVACRRELVDDLFAREEDLEEWSRLASGVLPAADEEQPLWVNVRRGSPSNWALAELDRWACEIERNPAADIPYDSEDFANMLKFLPRGGELSAAAKSDLNVLRRWAGEKKRGRKRESLKEELWQVYFGKPVRGDSSLVTAELIEQLWQVLDGVTERHFGGNTFIDQIRLGVAEPVSYYDPSTDDIGISRAALRVGKPHDPVWFEELVLHEVGHGVHAMHQVEVDVWLESTFGWRRFETSEPGIDTWIEAMGGLRRELSGAQRRQIRSYIRQSVGNGRAWVPPNRPKVADGHPWKADDFGPRLACERTAVRDPEKRWYDFHQDWHTHEAHRFFVNYYYGELMVVGPGALECVRNGALDAYALMAPAEFFAELYMTVNARSPEFRERAEKLDPELVRWVRGLASEPRDEIDRVLADRRPPSPVVPEATEAISGGKEPLTEAAGAG